MQSHELERFLEMVDGLHSRLDRYVAESILPAAAVPEIFKFCRRMRALNPDSTIEYWLDAIERHATEICELPMPSEEIGSLPRSARLLSSYLHVLKDVHNLHTWLRQPHAVDHPRPRLPDWQQMSLV